MIYILIFLGLLYFGLTFFFNLAPFALFSYLFNFLLVPYNIFHSSYLWYNNRLTNNSVYCQIIEYIKNHFHNNLFAFFYEIADKLLNYHQHFIDYSIYGCIPKGNNTNNNFTLIMNVTDCDDIIPLKCGYTSNVKLNFMIIYYMWNATNKLITKNIQLQTYQFLIPDPCVITCVKYLKDIIPELIEYEEKVLTECDGTTIPPVLKDVRVELLFVYNTSNGIVTVDSSVEILPDGQLIGYKIKLYGLLDRVLLANETEHIKISGTNAISYVNVLC